jgi:hypothetical protein
VKLAYFHGEWPNALKLVLVPDDTPPATRRNAVFDEDLLPDGSVIVYLRPGESLPAVLAAHVRQEQAA